MNQTSSGLRRREKLAYAVGDVCVGGTFNIVNLFYAIFLTDIIGLEAFYAAPVMLIVRLYDAFIDPFLGALSDRTKSRFGRRRIYLILGAPAVLASFMLLFFPFAVPTQLGRFVLALICFLVFSTVISIISVPYYALSGELTLDYTERTSLLSYRLVFSLAASAVCSLVPKMLVDMMPTLREGYILMGAVFGSLFALCIFLSGFFTRERADMKPLERDGHMLRDMFRTLTVKTFRQYLLLQVLKCVCMSIMSLIVPYYCKYYTGRESDQYLILGIIFLAQLCALPLYNRLARRFSKAKVFSISSVGWILSGLLILLVKPDTPTPLLCACAFAMGFSMCGVVLMPNAMFGDVADVGELKLHSRQEGAFGGFECIAYQSASALANALAMVALGAAGYVANAVQTPAAAQTIRLILCLSPLLFLLPALVVAARYKLDAPTHRRLSACLDARRAGRPAVEEESTLMEMLV